MMLAPIEMMRLTVDGMMARGFGRIVNIRCRAASRFRSSSSPVERRPLRPGRLRRRPRPPDGVAKRHHQQPSARHFDSDAQREHVRGMVTPDKSFDDIWRSRAAANPAMRYGNPDELGAYFAFLCSVNAGFITGQNLLDRRRKLSWDLLTKTPRGPHEKPGLDLLGCRCPE